MKTITTLTILLAFSAHLTSAADSLINQMLHAPSPYLQQHAKDKVHWQAWSSDSLALAKQQQKPILLSIGYFACHWCHVMQQESYQNTAVAEMLNQHFIPIKVDRELEPGLDQAMLNYAKSLIGVAGWPLNIYLTPDARPFDAHVYLDATALAARLDKNQAQQSTAKTINIAPKITRHSSAKLDSDAFLQAALAQIDTTHGGFMATRKFPQTPILMAMSRLLKQTPNVALQTWFDETLTQMVNHGLYDAVNGGFFRYTVDSEWKTPHFEKMLIDNAQLWQLYAQLSPLSASQDWAIVAEQTREFMLTHLYDAEKGAFFTSLSALDNAGHEGGHYLWTQKQLAQHLAVKEQSLVASDWQLDYPPPFDLGYLPIWGDHLRPDAQRQAIMNRLKTSRASQPIATDKKHLVSYNGLMLSVLSQQLRQQPTLKPIAQKLVSFLYDAWKNDQLSQGSFLDKKLAEADFEGYAFAAKGLLDYAIITGDADASELAINLLKRSQKLFVNDQGFIAQAPVGDFSLPRQLAFADSALISASSVWIEACLQSRNAQLTQITQQSFKKALPLMLASPLEYASLWSVYWKWQDLLLKQD